MSWLETKLLMTAIVENGISSSNGTIIMVPMDANKYGYNMKLLDIDGITPLQDVKINGVTDPNTEIRTNANGVAKFISGSPSHSVTFSEFPAGYQYADIFTARTIRGYINDMTEIIVAPDISEFAGFKVTLLDNRGAPVTNRQVTCTQNGKKYTTNSAGQIPQTIYSNTTSLTFTWSTTAIYSWSTVNGSLQRGNNTNFSATVSGGAIGEVKTLTSANATTSAGSPNSSYRVNVSATVGQYVTINAIQYVIAHVDTSNVYVTLRYWREDTKFGDDNDYVGSTIAQKCDTWYSNYLPPEWKTSANAFNSVNTEGVRARCFIPTDSQVNGGWTLFNNESARIFTDSAGTAKSWWTSTGSSSGRVYIVRTGGDFGNSIPTTSHGFRPALSIKRSLFN